MDNTSLRDFNKGEGREVLATPRRYGGSKKPEEAGAFPQHEEVPRHGKNFGTCSFSGLSFLAPNLCLAYF